MKVKVPLIYWETQEKVICPKTKEEKIVMVKHYEPDVKGITYVVIKYNYDERWAIIEIDKKDYEKIKDKVIEVIEQ